MVRPFEAQQAKIDMLESSAADRLEPSAADM